MIIEGLLFVYRVVNMPVDSTLKEVCKMLSNCIMPFLIRNSFKFLTVSLVLRSTYSENIFRTTHLSLKRYNLTVHRSQNGIFFPSCVGHYGDQVVVIEVHAPGWFPLAAGWIVSGRSPHCA